MSQFSGHVLGSGRSQPSRLPHEHRHGFGGASRNPPPFRFGGRRPVSTEGMDLKRPLLALALASSLVACGGDNTNVQRGETNCDSATQDAANPHDATCSETAGPSSGH
jgi:hypothetical protein